MEAADRHGGLWKECSVRLLSSTIRDLGVPDMLNALMYNAGIRSARKLRSIPLEEFPSRTYPVGYDGAMEIIRFLAQKRRPVLLGGVATRQDLMELLPWPRRKDGFSSDALAAYRKVKETGLHRTSDLVELDSVALKGLLGRVYHDVVGGLLAIDLTPAPLLPARSLSELDGSCPMSLDPSTPVGGLSLDRIPGLMATWRYVPEDGEVEHTVSELTALMERNFTRWPVLSQDVKLLRL